jgi:hypothetical protein
MIRTRNIDARTPARYVRYFNAWEFAASTNKTGIPLGVCAARDGEVIKNILVSTPVAGSAGGTSMAFTVKKNGTTVCATDAVLARSDGDNASVDVLGYVTKPAGATKAVLSATLSAITLAYGDDLSVDIALTGTYSGTFPKAVVTVITEGKQ